MQDQTNERHEARVRRLARKHGLALRKGSDRYYLVDPSTRGTRQWGTSGQTVGAGKLDEIEAALAALPAIKTVFGHWEASEWLLSRVDYSSKEGDDKGEHDLGGEA